MAYTVDAVSIRGLRRAHLNQLVRYIRNLDKSRYGHGPRFERRHVDLLAWAARLEALACDPYARFPTGPQHSSQESIEKWTVNRA